LTVELANALVALVDAAFAEAGVSRMKSPARATLNVRSPRCNSFIAR
jgi:hypothetical protein